MKIARKKGLMLFAAAALFCAGSTIGSSETEKTESGNASATSRAHYFRDDFNTLDTSIWSFEITKPTVSNGILKFTLLPGVAPNRVNSWSKILYKPRKFTTGTFTVRYALNHRPAQAVWWGIALWDDGPAANEKQFNEINFGYTTDESFKNSQLYVESAKRGNDVGVKVDDGVDLYNGTYHIAKLVVSPTRVEYWFDGVLKSTITDPAKIPTDPMDFLIGPRLANSPNLTSEFDMYVDYVEITW